MYRLEKKEETWGKDMDETVSQLRAHGARDQIGCKYAFQHIYVKHYYR